MPAPAADVQFGRSPALPGARPVPVIQGRRATELADDERNWMLRSPEEAMEGFVRHEILKLPRTDSTRGETENSSALERFYERLSRPQNATNSSRGQDLFGREIIQERRNTIPATEEGPGYDASRMLSVNPFQSGLADREVLPGGARRDELDLRDLLGPQMSPEQIRAREFQEQQMRDFRKLLDLPPISPSFGMSPQPAPTPSSGFQSTPNPIVSGSPATVGSTMGMTPSPGFQGPVAPTAPLQPGMPAASTHYGDSSLSPGMPSGSSSRIAPLPQPSFTPPQRPF